MAMFYYAWRWREETRARYAREMQASFRRASDPVDALSETEFRHRYRLSKNAFRILCEELKHAGVCSTQRVTLELKVLCALFFYATGSYQRPIGVTSFVSQTACSRYIQEITMALIHPIMIEKYIKFPQTMIDRRVVSQQFYSKYGIPGVIGCIDCTHIKIVKPPNAEEHIYYSRKRYHSMNVQMICDSNCRILNVNSKYGGSNHDSFIWQNSQVNEYMQGLHRSNEMVWLLGDSGYPQRPWLMTPYANVDDAESPQGVYNHRHIRARVMIENTFGRLKNRWRCLCKDRVLHYSPTKCAQIIQACCVLHNFAMDFRVPDPERDQGEDDGGAAVPEELVPERGGNTDLVRGRVFRDRLAQRIFMEHG